MNRGHALSASMVALHGTLRERAAAWSVGASALWERCLETRDLEYRRERKQTDMPHASNSAEMNSRVPGGPVSSREIGPPSVSTVMLKRRKRQHCRSASIVCAMTASISPAGVNHRRWPCGSSSWLTARRRRSASSPSRLAWSATGVSVHMMGRSAIVTFYCTSLGLPGCPEGRSLQHRHSRAPLALWAGGIARGRHWCATTGHHASSSNSPAPKTRAMTLSDEKYWILTRAPAQRKSAA